MKVSFGENITKKIVENYEDVIKSSSGKDTLGMKFFFLI